MADVAQILDHLHNHFNVLIYGPPGTGKTYLMQEVVRSFRSGGGDADEELLIDTPSEDVPLVMEPAPKVKIGWVTFHQSYSYEEFIVGLRPDPASEKLLSLDPSPGLLLELTEFARQPGHSALLVIDEINRGNVSRVFGEFITLHEADKRLDDEGEITPQTVEVHLPYIKGSTRTAVDVDGNDVEVENPFTMPRRLYTLASMNSVDKSIAPLDSALRRRFHVVELAPDLAAMATRLGIDPTVLQPPNLPADPLDVAGVRTLGLLLLQRLNFGISVYLGAEFALGEWYLGELLVEFDDDASAAGALKAIWDFKLYPQLAELFHGRSEQLASILGIEEGTPPESPPVFLEQPTEKMLELGAVGYVQRRKVDADATIGFLRRVVLADASTPGAAP